VQNKKCGKRGLRRGYEFWAAGNSILGAHWSMSDL